MGISVVALCLILGVAISRYSPVYVLGLVGLSGAAAIAWWNRGVLAGILVLLLLQGIPLVNTQLGSSSARGANILNDGIFVALVILLAGFALQQVHNKVQHRLTVLVTLWAVCYFAWWTYKVVAGSPGVPFLAAVGYGREFMGFSIFLPLALIGLSRRVHLVGFATILAVGAAIFATGQILVQVTGAQLTWLIHPYQIAEFQGVARIYAPMTELLTAALPMAFAAMLLGPKAWRRYVVPLTVLIGVATALSFTRAIYISELLALLLISLIWAQGSEWQSRRIRYSFVVGIVTAMVIVTITIAGGSTTSVGNAQSPAQAVVSRVELGVNNLQDQTGTIGYRLREAHVELEALGDHWVTGLGFLSPDYHYVLGLRQGSIRNDDLGSLSILMTMGLIGLLLAYMPPIGGLIYLIRRRHSFVQYGGAMYLGAALIGSITLGAISTLSGLLVLGSMLALCLNWTALDVSTSLRPTLGDAYHNQ